MSFLVFAITLQRGATKQTFIKLLKFKNYGRNLSTILVNFSKNLLRFQLSGCGCPLCTEPSGEKRVRLYLEKRNISYKKQYAIKYKGNNYMADFFVPSKKLIIEYNGAQHYKSVKQFGGAKKFHQQKQRDNNVRDYCKKNNIKLLEISYLQYPIIEQTLDVVF